MRHLNRVRFSSFVSPPPLQLAQLQNMSEVIRKGIEQAQGELQRESDEAIWQEGILRHVPLVGRFYNWMSPLQKVRERKREREGGELELIILFPGAFSPRLRVAVSTYKRASWNLPRRSTRESHP